MTDEGSRAILRGHCPNCNADRNAEVVAEDTSEEEEIGVWFRSTYSILRCLGCDKRYIRFAELSSEDYDNDLDPATGETFLTHNTRVTYWPPIPTSRRSDWLWEDLDLDLVRRSRLFGQLPGRNKLKIGSRLLVSPFPEIKFILCCCGVL